MASASKRTPDDDRDEDAALPGPQRLAEGPAENAGELTGLSLLRRVGTEPVGDAFPRIGAHLHRRIAPVVSVQLGRRLENDELVRHVVKRLSPQNWSSLLVIASSVSSAA
jgi:hypothetical protein